MAMKLSNLSYKIGVPGMVATTGYKHTRQQVEDSIWVNKTAAINFPFGVAACADPVTGNICLADIVNAEFIGIFQDPSRFIDQPYYAPKDPVIVLTMGDIWVPVDPALVIKPLTDNVYYIKLAGATLGKFTNVAGVNATLIPNAKFVTTNAGGIAVLALGAWGVSSV